MAKTCVAAVCALALALAGACVLGGCKDTNVVKNIIHDQTAEKIDTSAQNQERVVAPSGEFIDEDTGLYERAGKGDKALAANVVYASKDAESELPVARFAYDENSKNSSEATEGVRVAEQQRPDDEQDEDEDDRQQSAPQTHGSAGGAQDPGTADDESGSDDKGNKGDKGDKDDDDGASGDPADRKPSGTGGDDADATVYDTTGKDPDIPEAASIAAYGQAAVIVQMLGGYDGSSPLVAADDALCASAFSKVFADEGADQISSAAWHFEGAGAYEPDIGEIVDAKPDTVLVFSDSMFTKAEKKKLAKKDISITVVPSLVSDTGIMRAVYTVAKVLDKATDGESVQRYEAYKDYHDSLISDIEGSRGYGAYNNEVYDASASSKLRRFNAKKFTLLVDEWDYDARFSYKQTISDAGAGVGVAKVGYRLSPASYYLGVAGVVNSSAAIDTTKPASGMLVPAWQFNANDLQPKDIDFSSRAFSSKLYGNWGTGFTKTTLVRPNTGKNDLYRYGFGTDAFPVVILGTGEMRDAFKRSAADPHGLYHPYGVANVGIGDFHGADAKGTAVFTTIDPDVDLDEALLVNPHGLFSSWTEGSVESLLESAWAANIEAFENDWDGSVKDEVSGFYKTFYRYSAKNSEVKSILAGLEK